MKLGSALTLISLSALTIAFAQGCSDSDDGPGSNGGGGAQTGKVPPAEEGEPTSATDERVFAVHTLFLGDTDRSGTKSKDAWKQYGYNLDGLMTSVTDSKSPDLAKVCKRVDGADAKVHHDGEGGIDNAFGSQILPLLETLTPTPSKTISDNIQAGEFTIMFNLKGLTDDPEQTNTGLSGKLLVGGKFGDSAPTFSPADDWPYVPDPQVDIPGAYINKGTFVNGTGGAQVKLSLSFGGQSLSLTINKAIITFNHNPSGKALEEGTIAGVIRTEELLSGLDSIAGQFGACDEGAGAFDGIKDMVRQASDILSDGSQDPAKVCDGISVGIGFTAKQIGIPTKQAPLPEPSDPCADDES